MNILILRASAIGDVVMASGLIPALKSAYPGAKISWLAEPAAAQLLTENPNIEQLFIWDKQSWKALWKQKKFTQLFRCILAFRRELRDAKFDLALDAQGIFKSSFLAWLSGAQRRIGIGKREGSWLFNTESIPFDPNHPDISSEYKALAQYNGASQEDYQMQLLYSDKTQTKIQTLLSPHVNSKEEFVGRYIVLCPFTTRPQKHWIDTYWPELIKKLNAEFDLPIAILGGPGDKTAATDIATQSDAKIINLAGSTQLLDAVAIIDHAKLLVGVDTGLTHVGIAQNTPTVTLFGSTKPYLNTSRDNAIVLYEQLDCSPCRRNPTCHGDFTCMRQLTPDIVMQNIKTLIYKEERLHMQETSS